MLTKLTDLVKFTQKREEARRRLVYSFMLPIDLYRDIPIYVSDDMLLFHMGVPTNHPGIMLIKQKNGTPGIFINEMARHIPVDYMNAALAHEYAHYIHKDAVKSTTMHFFQLKFGFGYAMEKEYAADKYAFDQGHDILGLLRHIQSFNDSKEIRLRIERIKILKN